MQSVFKTISLILLCICISSFAENNNHSIKASCTTNDCKTLSKQVDYYWKSYNTAITPQWGQDFRLFLKTNSKTLKCCIRKCGALPGCVIEFKKPSVVDYLITNLEDINNLLKHLGLTWIDAGPNKYKHLPNTSKYYLPERVDLLIENIGILRNIFWCCQIN